MRLLPEDEQFRVSASAQSIGKANRLSMEKSPYLLQHAFNPVDWYPWGEEAFEKARREDKPIFLSIGYSTCYWCHVMEREVFENRRIADLLNLMAVNIKVDREERPDIDQIYMTALQAMTGNGGWPISIFMTPDRDPFFAGTYIPPETKQGRIGFHDLLLSLHRTWINKRSDVLKTGENIRRFLVDSSTPAMSDSPVTEQVLSDCFDFFEKNFDDTYGGFSGAPKFPRPSIFNFLFRYHQRTGNCTARDMALTTLQNMAEGGMYDQLGGGFHRYSTDERWHVPHFEKMLYDQALLIISYLEAFQITRDPFFSQIAQEILKYVECTFLAPEGGFYSAEDAESASSAENLDEKKEGAFYLWKKSEFDTVLNEKEAKIMGFIYGVREQGNVLSDPRQEFLGENVLSIVHSVEEAAHIFHENIEDVQAYFDNARIGLFEHRSRRPRPQLDDKILLSWNGLTISAFAHASQILGDTSYLEEASKTARFLLTVLTEAGTARLLRRYRDGEAKFEAHLADYAFFVQGLLDLYEASSEIEWLQAALRLTGEQNDMFSRQPECSLTGEHIVLFSRQPECSLTGEQNDMFYDNSYGGFFDISGNDPTLSLRMKEIYDNAEPSGNAVAVLNLLRLSQMCGNEQFSEMAAKSIVSFSKPITSSPQVLPYFLVAVDFNFLKPVEFIFSENKKNPAIQDMLNEIHAHFIPHKTLLFRDSSEIRTIPGGLVSLSELQGSMDGKPAVCICEYDRCNLPISDVNDLRMFLTKRHHDSRKRETQFIQLQRIDR